MKLEQNKITIYKECPRMFKWKRILPIERGNKMLDKTKIYDAVNNCCSTRRRNVRILFEDEIGYFVQSLTQFDSQRNGIRWSIKKHFYKLVEVQMPEKADVCRGCKLLKIANELRQYSI